MDEADSDLLRRQSRWMGWLSLVLLVSTALVIIVPAVLGLARKSAEGEAWLDLLLWNLVGWSPSLFHLYALWAIRRVFGSIAGGGLFGPIVARGCTRAGYALAVGATLSAVGIPNLQRLLVAQGVRPASAYFQGSVLHFDTAYLAVGVVGLSLVLLGRLLARAAELQGEAARLKGELDGFF